jgi:hypothetical protein
LEKSLICTDLKYQGKAPLDYQYIINYKNEGKEAKINPSCGWVPVGGGRHKERGNVGAYDRCVLYPYMKTEE